MARQDIAKTLDTAIDRRQIQRERSGTVVSVDRSGRKVRVRTGSGAPVDVDIPHQIEPESIEPGASVRVLTGTKKPLLLGAVGSNAGLSKNIEQERRMNQFEQRLIRLETLVAQLVDAQDKGLVSEQIRAALLHALGAGASGVTGDIFNG